MPNIAKPSSLNALEQVSTRRYINPQRTQQKLVAGSEHVLFSIYMGCHPNPIDFHSHVSRWAHCTSNQKNRQGQLGECLQHHQDLLGALDRDEGTGYGSGPALPPLIRAAPGAAIRKPPKPPALGRRSREEAKKMEEQQEEATFFLFDQTCVVLMFFLCAWTFILPEISGRCDLYY